MGYQRMTQAEWADLIAKQGYENAVRTALQFGTVLEETGAPPSMVDPALAARPMVTPPQASATMPPATQGTVPMDTPVGGLTAATQQPAQQQTQQQDDLLQLQQELINWPAKREALRAQQFEEGKRRIEQMYSGPSQSDQMYALAQAFLAPRRYGGFAETLGNVSRAFGGIRQQRRAAEQSRAEALARLQESYQTGQFGDESEALKLRYQVAKERAEQNKPKIAKPVGTQLVNGKVVTVLQAPDTGAISTVEIGSAPNTLKPITGVTSGGQPVFMGSNGPVDASGNPVRDFDTKAKPVSATEQRQIFDTEDSVNSGLSTLTSLEDALSLNQQAFEGSLTGWRKTMGQLFSSDDPGYVATENFDNIVGTGALRDLKSMFGANPTEGERKIYMELQAISSKTRKVREDILRRAMAAVKARIGRETDRLKRLKGGEYGSRGGSTAGAPSGTPRIINWGQ